jgi:hypothetical protein
MEQNRGMHRIKTKTGTILIRIKKFKNGHVLISPMPLTHGITGGQKTPFTDLITILKSGFIGGKSWGDKCNVVWQKTNQRKRFGMMGAPETTNHKLEGDYYAIEMIAPMPTGTANFVSKAKPAQIISVNIQLSNYAGQKEYAAKKAFYKLQIQKRLGIPVKFL